MGLCRIFLLLCITGSLECFEKNYLIMLPMDVEHELDIKFKASKPMAAKLELPDGCANTKISVHDEYIRVFGKECIPHGGVEKKALTLVLTTIDDVIIGPLDVTVVCSGHHSEHYAYLALPISALGTDYIISTYISPAHGHSQFLIAAAHQDTKVTITLDTTKSFSFQGNYYTRGQVKEITLNQNQTFSISASNSDITGTVIRSSKPVAVYAGNFKVVFPVTDVNLGHKNPTLEQFPPVHLLGQKYVAPFIQFCMYQEIKVVAAFNDTVVSVSGQDGNVTMNQADQLSLPLTRSVMVLSSRPVLLTTMCQGHNGNSPVFLSIIPPVGRYKKAYLVPHQKTESSTTAQNLIIISCYEDTGSLSLDNHVIDSKYQWERVGNFAVTSVSVDNGHHTVTSKTRFGLLETVYENGVELTTSGLYLGLELESPHDAVCNELIPQPPSTVSANTPQDATVSAEMSPDSTLSTATETPTVTPGSSELVIIIAVLVILLAIVIVALAAVVLYRRRFLGCFSQDRQTSDAPTVRNIVTADEVPDHYDRLSISTSGSSHYCSAHTVNPGTHGTPAAHGGDVDMYTVYPRNSTLASLG